MARLSKDKIDEAVNKWGKDTVRKVRAALTREKGLSTKKLWRSIRYRYFAKAGIIEFSMEPYGAFLDKGVSGTGKLHHRGGKVTPVPYNKSEARPQYKFKSSKKTIGGNLSKWLQSKGMPKSMDFVVRRSVHARGIRPRRFFSDVFEQQMDEFDVVLNEAATVMVEETLDEILEPLKQQ